MNTRFGILGTGPIVGKYAQACRLLPGLELVAIASRAGDRARATAAKLGIPRAFAGYESLLADPEVDAVIVALHNGLHCEWTCRALASGKHVLCEKPLACNAAEALQMFAAAHANQRWLLEGFMYRYHPQMPEIFRRVRVGEIGRVLHVNTRRMSQGREAGNMRYRQDAGGGALLDIGCYCVSFAQAVTGREPVCVNASAHFDPATGVDLTLTGTLEFASEPSGGRASRRAEPIGGRPPQGAEPSVQPELRQESRVLLGLRPPDVITAQFCCSFESEPSYSAEVIGTAGRILIPHPWMPPSWPTDFTVVRSGTSETIRIEPPGAPAHVLTSFVLELAHFADCIQQNRAPIFPPGDDAEQASLGIARTLDAVIASAQRI